MTQVLTRLWEYRYFIVSSIRLNVMARYRRSKLGGLWVIIHPLAYSAILGFILSSVLATKLPGANDRFSYSLFIMSGSLGWALFSDVVMRCLTVFIDNGSLLKKISFPRICLPMIAGGASLVNNAFLLFAILGLSILMGHFPGHSIVWMPVLMGLTVTLAAGVGVLLGVLNVFLRDIGQTVPVLLQFLFWVTPVVYPSSLVPDRYHRWLSLNPLFGLISGYQNVLVFGVAPDLASLRLAAAVAVVTVVAAVFLYRKGTPEMMDVL